MCVCAAHNVISNGPAACVVKRKICKRFGFFFVFDVAVSGLVKISEWVSSGCVCVYAKLKMDGDREARGLRCVDRVQDLLRLVASGFGVPSDMCQIWYSIHMQSFTMKGVQSICNRFIGARQFKIHICVIFFGLLVTVPFGMQPNNQIFKKFTRDRTHRAITIVFFSERIHHKQPHTDISPTFNTICALFISMTSRRPFNRWFIINPTTQQRRTMWTD